MSIAMYPGSFDPVTMGHVDVITRALSLYEKLFVVVMVNPNKTSEFTVDERVEFLQKSVPKSENIIVTHSEGLLVDFAKENGINVVLKGLRAVSDFEYEFSMALTNKKLCSEIETVFLPSSSQYMFLSSSIVKNVSSFKGDIKELVPASIKADIEQHFHKKVGC